MRMNDHRRPMGMASGKLTMTSAMAISHPLNTTGTEVTMMLGSKNRWRNLLEFHAFTQSCMPSQVDNCSAGDVLTTSNVLSVAGMSSVCPSAVV